MRPKTTFDFDATDPEEPNDGGRAERRPDRRGKWSRFVLLEGTGREVKFTWSRGHTVPEHLRRGYAALVAAFRREDARYENVDCDEYLDDEADCDDEQID
jgi:hypothetical protein